MDFLIFDFETLSNIPSSAPIISWGAIAGNWKDENTIESLRETGFYRDVDAIEQITKYGLETTKDTIDWWSKQGDEAKKVLNSKNKESLPKVINDFNKWCTDVGVTHQTKVYIRAPHFDYVIYENLLKVTGKNVYYPFSHWKIRDTRSIIDVIYNVNNGYVPNFRATLKDLNLYEHNAIDDCIKEYLQLVDYFKSL